MAKRTATTDAAAAREERRGPFGGQHLFVIVPASQVQQTMNDAHEAGYLNADWMQLEGEAPGAEPWQAGDAAAAGPQFIVYGSRPGPECCPACGSDLTAEEPED